MLTNTTHGRALEAASFAIHSTTNRLEGQSLGLLVFGRDIILPIKHNVNWELIRQKKQRKMNKYNIHKKNIRFDNKYKVADKGLLTNNAAYKYETL